MTKLVNISALNSPPLQSIDGVVPAINAQTVVTAKAPDKLQQVIDAAMLHDAFHFVCDGSWSTHDLLLMLMPIYGPCKVWLTTYSITEFPARILAGFVESKLITELNVLMDYRAKDRYPAVQQLMSNISTIRLTPIHAKVLILESEDKCITLLGSANWTTNKRIEAGVFDRSAAVKEFHKSWITKKMQDGDPFE